MRVRLWTYADLPQVTLHEKPAKTSELLVEALIDGRLAGRFWMAVDRAPGNPASDLFIYHNCHGYGLGVKLMTAMAELASDRGLPWLEVQVHEDNDPAQRRYGQLGWQYVDDDQIGKDSARYRLYRLDLPIRMAA